MTDPRKPDRPREFAETLGDQQRSGDPRTLGLGPPPVPSKVGIAPPSPLQVQSVFDTRPMSAFDFAFDATLLLTNEAPSSVAEVQVPDGYTAVLRAVELESMSGINTSYTGVLDMSLLRARATIPYNLVSFRSTLTFYRWPTHHVFGAWETLGVRLSIPSIVPVAAGNLRFTARFFGVLIPSRSLPAQDEVGSNPVMIRVYQPVASEGL